MSKFGNRVAKLSGLVVLALFAMGTSQASALAIWNGTSPAANDSTSWAGLGADGATISSPFSATSTDGVAITGTLAGGSGLASIQCPALPSCSWTGGFTAGDHLVWTLNNATGLGTAPLTLAFGKSVLAGGVEIQSDVPGAFTADVQAFDGGTSLGTETLASDAAGDPIFIGAQDTTADITSLVFSCTGACGNNDFAVDTLMSRNPAVVPAPLIGFGLPAFLAVGGLLFGAKLLRCSQRAAGLFDIA
jgi:hypothetical protein